MEGHDDVMKQENVGAIIVGTSFGVLTHLRAFRRAGIEIHALVGRNPEKTRQRAAMSVSSNARRSSVRRTTGQKSRPPRRLSFTRWRRTFLPGPAV